MIHRFKKFLIDNGIYDRYTDKAIDLSDEDPQYYIIYAFLWSETPEGSEYWSNINNKWLEIVLTEERNHK